MPPLSPFPPPDGDDPQNDTPLLPPDGTDGPPHDDGAAPFEGGCGCLLTG